MRAYVIASLLAPPRGVRLGWRMPRCPLPARVVLAILPLVGPVGGVVFLLRKAGVIH